MGCGAGAVRRACSIRQQPAPETRVVAVVFLGLLLDLLAFTLLLPLLPGLLESHGRAHVSPSPPAPLPLRPAVAAPGSQPPEAPQSATPSCPPGPALRLLAARVDWFAAAIGMPAEKRYNSVLFGGAVLSWAEASPRLVLTFSLWACISAPSSPWSGPLPWGSPGPSGDRELCLFQV